MLLSMECSGNSVSVALFDGQHLLRSAYNEMERGQGEALMPMIETVLKSCSVTPKQLTQIAVAVGPGSFTGVRVSLAAARGLALALKIPVVGVTNFETAAFECPGRVLVALDTKRGDFYTQIFESGVAVSEPSILTRDQLNAQSLPVVGVSPAKTIPAVAVGRVALARLGDPLPAEPLYLREAHVTVAG